MKKISNKGFMLAETLIVTVFVMGMFVIDILVPIAIIVGFNKARIILLLLAIVPVCFSSTIVSILSKLPPLNFNISDGMVEAGAIIFGIVLTTISYFITANLYKKKEIV